MRTKARDLSPFAFYAWLLGAALIGVLSDVSIDAAITFVVAVILLVFANFLTCGILVGG